MSQSYPIQGKQTDTVQPSLEREFPGQARNLRWDRHTSMQMFEVDHETTVHRVEMPAAFFEDCPDYAAALRDSALADYMREARDQMRRFSVVWETDEVRTRSTPLGSRLSQ
jgi:hypothetical protein